MKLLPLFTGLSCATVAAGGQVPLSLFSNDQAVTRIPSSYESAVMGRRILALSKLGDLATVFPHSHSHSYEHEHGHVEDGADVSAHHLPAHHRPTGLGGVPISLVDYVADCEDEGNPTLLAIKIATAFRNADAGSNITLSMRWAPPYPPAKRISFLSRITAHIPFLGGASHYHEYNQAQDATPDPAPYSAANLPRFALMGYLERIHPDPVQSARLAACFTAKHRDAKWWLPGNVVHESEWARLVVTQVFWVGGFGDRAFIGWIPVDEWKSVTKEEWSSIKLPGEEKGWSEWSVNPVDEL